MTGIKPTATQWWHYGYDEHGERRLTRPRRKTPAEIAAELGIFLVPRANGKQDGNDRADE